MSEKCEGKTSSGKSCSRNKSKGDFCWHHCRSPEWQHSQDINNDHKVQKPHPKRPLSAFMYFAGAKRTEIKQEHPNWGIPDIGKEITTRWKLASADERQIYENIAAKDKSRYQSELASDV